MQIKDIINENDLRKYFHDYLDEKGQSSLHRAIQNSKKLKNLIESFTKDEDDLTLSARSQLIIDNIERPLCLICNKKTSFEKNNRRFLECCSVKCAANNPRRINQIKNSNLEKFGNENFWGSKDHQNNLVQSAFDKHGVDHYFKSDDFKTKTELTSIEKYGTKLPVQSEIVKNKIKESLSKVDRKIWQEKKKKTFIKNYGVEHPMKCPEFFNNQLKKSYYRKDYFLPSGKKIQLQGYEPLCLDILLKTYNEDDILTNIKDIFTTIGPIDYLDKNGKEHRYFPDFYILKENKIIEVKSTRTYLVHLALNELKREECIKRGFEFEFWIFGKEGCEIK